MNPLASPLLTDLYQLTMLQGRARFGAEELDCLRSPRRASAACAGSAGCPRPRWRSPRRCGVWPTRSTGAPSTQPR